MQAQDVGKREVTYNRVRRASRGLTKPGTRGTQLKVITIRDGLAKLKCPPNTDLGQLAFDLEIVDLWTAALLLDFLRAPRTKMVSTPPPIDHHDGRNHLDFMVPTAHPSNRRNRVRSCNLGHDDPGVASWSIGGNVAHFTT